MIFKVIFKVINILMKLFLFSISILCFFNIGIPVEKVSFLIGLYLFVIILNIVLKVPFLSSLAKLKNTDYELEVKDKKFFMDNIKSILDAERDTIIPKIEDFLNIALLAICVYYSWYVASFLMFVSIFIKYTCYNLCIDIYERFKHELK